MLWSVFWHMYGASINQLSYYHSTLWLTLDMNYDTIPTFTGSALQALNIYHPSSACTLRMNLEYLWSTVVDTLVGQTLWFGMRLSVPLMALMKIALFSELVCGILVRSGRSKSFGRKPAGLKKHQWYWQIHHTWPLAVPSFWRTGFLPHLV